MAKEKGVAVQVNVASFRVTMTQDKVTKGAVRFAEDHVTETEADRIGQLYVKKSAFPDGAPQQITVVVTAGVV